MRLVSASSAIDKDPPTSCLKVDRVYQKYYKKFTFLIDSVVYNIEVL